MSLAEEEGGADSIFGSVKRHVQGRLAASNHYNLEKKNRQRNKHGDGGVIVIFVITRWSHDFPLAAGDEFGVGYYWLTHILLVN